MDPPSSPPPIVIQEAHSSDDRLPSTQSPRGHSRDDSLLLPSPAHPPRSSLEVPNSPSSDDGSSVPPSPTLTNQSSVHFETSLALRDNNPDASSGMSSMGLLAPPTDTHGRKGSVSSTGSTDNTLDGHGNELGLVPSNVTSNAGALSAKSVGTTVVDPDDVATEKELSKKELKDKKKKKKKGVPEERRQDITLSSRRISFAIPRRSL